MRMILGIDVVFLHVKDPNRMADWYRETLGIEIGFQTPDLHWQEFAFPDNRSPTRFGLDTVSVEESTVEMQKVMISFAVSDLEKLIIKLETKGIAFLGDPKIIDAGPTIFATTKDPEGNVIQFSQRK